MLTIHKTALDAKIAAVNNANRYALEIYPKLRAVFEPFIGQKIEKADGGLLMKIAKLLPDFPCSPGLHVYKFASDYSLVWCVKTCESADSGRGNYQHAHYHEACVYVASVRNGVLESLYDAPKLRTDYTAAEIEAARETYRKAKQAADDARSALNDFGEYDR